MEALAILSITEFISHVLAWKLNTETTLQFFSHHFKDAHFVYTYIYFLPHRQICLWQFLVAITYHKSYKHSELYLQS